MISNGVLKALAATLWLTAAILGGLTLFFAFNGATDARLITLGLGAAFLTAAAGTGLFLRQRWGAALFGVLAMAGSINYVVGALLRLPQAAQNGDTAALAAVFTVFGGVLMTMAMGYLTARLWRMLPAPPPGVAHKREPAPAPTQRARRKRHKTTPE